MKALGLLFVGFVAGAGTLGAVLFLKIDDILLTLLFLDLKSQVVLILLGFFDESENVFVFFCVFE